MFQKSPNFFNRKVSLFFENHIICHLLFKYKNEFIVNLGKCKIIGNFLLKNFKDFTETFPKSLELFCRFPLLIWVIYFNFYS